MDSSPHTRGNFSTVAVIGKQEHHILTPFTHAQPAECCALHNTAQTFYRQVYIYINLVNLREIIQPRESRDRPSDKFDIL